MRYGDSYNVGGIGMRGGYLNGCWDGWKLARVPPAGPALTAHNRFTQRVIDIAYTAFMAAKLPNKEDGGPSDWFMDARPVVLVAIEKLRKDLLAAAPQPIPALTDHDVQSLQMIAGWLNRDGNRDAATFLRGLAEKFGAPQPSGERK